MAFHENVDSVALSFMDTQKSSTQMENEAFSISQIEMDELTRLIHEYTRLTAHMAYEVDFDYKKFHDVNWMIKRLGEDLKRYKTFNPCYVEAIKRMIVFLQCEVGCKVSFYTVFDEMIKEGSLSLGYDELRSMAAYSYNRILKYFYKNAYAKTSDRSMFDIHVREVLKELSDKKIMISDYIENGEYILDEEYKNDSEYLKLRSSDFTARLSKVFKKTVRITNIEPEKLEQLLRVTECAYDDAVGDVHKLTPELVEFLGKVVTYLELEVGIPVSDRKTFIKMMANKELDINIDESIAFNEYSYSFLKKKFHYKEKGEELDNPHERKKKL